MLQILSNLFHSVLNITLRPTARELVRQGNRELYVSKIDGEPVLTEEAKVHVKEERTGLYIIYFYVADRDTVVTCELPSLHSPLFTLTKRPSEKGIFTMNDQFIRTRMLIGDDPIDRLLRAKIAVFGVGGVGGYCVEALARSGVGAMDLYDDDTVSESNLNRQIAALHSTIGQPKAEVMARRVLDINPGCAVKAIRMFYLPENAHTVDFSQYDYVIDCIDTVTAKLDLICRCTAQRVPIISAMGSGNKLDPTAFTVTDISKTQGCPLARIVRKELRKRGVDHLKVVYSTELPRTPIVPAQAEAPVDCDTRPGSTARRDTPGSISFVPAAAGLVLASAVVKDLTGVE